jgi:hypothetical protein
MALIFGVNFLEKLTHVDCYGSKSYKFVVQNRHDFSRPGRLRVPAMVFVHIGRYANLNLNSKSTTSAKAQSVPARRDVPLFRAKKWCK